MSTENLPKNIDQERDFAIIESVAIQGDLSKLTPQQRVIYYNKVCESMNLNPLTKPFSYINLSGKLVLYASKDCTEQLRKLNGISIESLESQLIDDVYIVKARARDKTGRVDESTGALVIGHLKGEAKANAIMKCETKAKRRVTLSISGLGWCDETEIETIPNATRPDICLETGDITLIKKNNAQPNEANALQHENQNVLKPNELVDGIPPIEPDNLPIEKINAVQHLEIATALVQLDKAVRENFFKYLKDRFKIDDAIDLPSAEFQTIINRLNYNISLKKQKETNEKA